MKKAILLVLTVSIFFTACGPGNNGELVGVQGRKKFFEPEPFEMSFIPAGNFIIGPSDQDAVSAMNTVSKSVTVNAFWMDQTEITNNKYRQFVYWVRDSILRTKLGEAAIADYQFFAVDEEGNEIDPPLLNWEEKIDLKNQEIKDIMEEMYYPPEERFNNRKQVDVRKLNYSYFWVDYKQAAKSRYNAETGEYEGQVTNMDGTVTDVVNRSSFIMNDEVNVYPDTLAWIRDFTYSFNDPFASLYFWHPSYDNYPVVGITWKQANAFSIWRTEYLNSALRSQGLNDVHAYRLPLETEWEYAARGNLDLSKFPWGGPYTRNYKGCFLANFKPLRGNYIDDGEVYTAKVASFEPNEFGLYDMAGNVAEWTRCAYHPSAYIFTHDLNPDYQYNAKPEDPPILKRKVIRGGSWKDIGYFLQTSTRDFEYQDSAKCFIGFRNVRDFIGVN
ncbi:MAG: SUMF1/EgtB/PvdO family nonheme iron enzyme [Marinilabiliaceae bacterium]|jgi:formylglycine-generating enzyme required for sulfatase activity|nr:SUMF1/EgtB/PvdO family nonheme iron enzyme [Marinilabiliaceae bacterium]